MTNQAERKTILEVDAVSKRYGSVLAVDTMSFTLREGESLGIVGESGSGKSTTARMIVGLEQPSSGEVRFSGSSETGRRAVAKRTQMIFQDPYQSFDPRMTIGQAIEEPLRLHFDLAPAAREARVRELLDQVGLSQKQAASYPRELSGGQRQRAAIARAIGVQPQILVLDEAVAALDVSIQAQVLVLLDEIRRETGMSFIFVTHDLAVVRYVSERTLVMRKGRQVEFGATEEILSNPQHPYTRLLLDSVPRQQWDLDRLQQDRVRLDAAMKAEVTATE